ncbi:MAG TPA: hypothetical protein VK530_16040, partial [Candidatus Acidoferrum sp.]|nr:hypothetical protein [Candidatus Acidoferrum sp.]
MVFATTTVAFDAETDARLRKLAEQNEQLQRTVAEQSKTISALSQKVSQIEEARGEALPGSPESDASARKFLGGLGSQTKVNISGQVAAAYFKTGREGMFPNGEFRLDDARIALDVRAWEDVYGFIELELTTREAGDENTHLGEAYIDLERIVKWRGLDSLVNFRIGRFYTPFGEEYLVRYPIDDPLITHSLSDFWAFDEGVEVYGSHGPLQYALAIQNGGVGALRDFTDDKTFAGRIAYEPAKWLRLSASGMRSGDISARND